MTLLLLVWPLPWPLFKKGKENSLLVRRMVQTKTTMHTHTSYGRLKAERANDYKRLLLAEPSFDELLEIVTPTVNK